MKSIFLAPTAIAIGIFAAASWGAQGLNPGRPGSTGAGPECSGFGMSPPAFEEYSMICISDGCVDCQTVMVDTERGQGGYCDCHGAVPGQGPRCCQLIFLPGAETFTSAGDCAPSNGCIEYGKCTTVASPSLWIAGCFTE